MRRALTAGGRGRVREDPPPTSARRRPTPTSGRPGYDRGLTGHQTRGRCGSNPRSGELFAEGVVSVIQDSRAVERPAAERPAAERPAVERLGVERLGTERFALERPRSNGPHPRARRRPAPRAHRPRDRTATPTCATGAPAVVARSRTTAAALGQLAADPHHGAAAPLRAARP
ncbi:hypothetical protein GCM10009660_27930 [Catellatospora bangladeshensis]